jgi:Glycerol kinase
MEFFTDASESEGLIDEHFDSKGINFISAFTRLGAPHWNSEIEVAFMVFTEIVVKRHNLSLF